MTPDDPTELRWRQRREEFRAALALLRDASDEGQQRALSVTERAGLVQFFALTTNSRGRRWHRFC